MKLLHVLTGDMDFGSLTDANIEALIAGDAAGGAPAHLSELVGALRTELHATPMVTADTALAEFVNVARLADVAQLSAVIPEMASIAGQTVSTTAGAIATVGSIPAKLMIGAAMTAASVGGAHAVGVVDVPGLPDTGPSVMVEVPVVPIDAPVEIPPVSRVDEPQRPTPGTTPSVVNERPAPPDAVRSRPEDPMTARPGLVDAEAGCEFGRDTADGVTPDADGVGVIRSHPTGPCDQPELVVPAEAGRPTGRTPENISRARTPPER